MIFPETVEDICVIVEMYGLTEAEVEAWEEALTSYLDNLNSNRYELLNAADELDNSRQEAEEYSEECCLLSLELASRVKYDETLAVVVEEVSWECVLAAGLAEELEEQVKELRRLEKIAEDHGRALLAFRELLREFIGWPECEDYD